MTQNLGGSHKLQNKLLQQEWDTIASNNRQVREGHTCHVNIYIIYIHLY